MSNNSKDREIHAIGIIRKWYWNIERIQDLAYFSIILGTLIRRVPLLVARCMYVLSARHIYSQGQSPSAISSFDYFMLNDMYGMYSHLHEKYPNFLGSESHYGKPLYNTLVARRRILFKIFFNWSNHKSRRFPIRALSRCVKHVTRVKEKRTSSARLSNLLLVHNIVIILPAATEYWVTKRNLPSR